MHPSAGTADQPFAADELAVTGRASFRIRAQIIALLGMLFINGLPIWWGLIATERGYSLLSFGMVQTAQMVGWGAMNLLLAFTLRRIALNWFAIGSFLTMSLMFLLMMMVVNVNVVIGATFLLSAAGAAAISLGNIYIGHTPNKVREYAIQGALVTAQTATLVLVLPIAHKLVGTTGIQIGYAILTLLGCAVALGLPSRLTQTEGPVEATDDHVKDSAARRRRFLMAGIPMIIAYILYQNYQLILFNFSEKVASLRGMKIDMTGWTISISVVLGSVLGAFLLAACRNFSVTMRAIVAIALSCMMIGLLYHQATGWLGYAVALTLFGVIYNFLHSIIFATNLTIDPSGRLLVVSGLSASLGGIVLTLFATGVSVTLGLQAVLLFVLVELIILPIFMSLAMRNSKRTYVSAIG